MEITVLSPSDIERIDRASMNILGRTGVEVPHEEMRNRFEKAGAKVDHGTKRGKWELVSLHPAPSDALDGLDEARELVSGSLGRASQLSFPEVEWLEEAA